MAANIYFLTAGYNIPYPTSGVGFFGDGGFAASIAVGSYNGRSYITSSDGSSQGPEGNNVKYLNLGSGILGQAGSGIGVLAIPNAQATLQCRFTYDSAVRVENVKLYCYDGYALANDPSGVTVKAAECIHPSPVQGTAGASGDSTFSTIAGTGSYLTLANSPGCSGLYAGNGSNSTRTDTVHDWYSCLSVSPTTIGSKTFKAALFVEYF